MTTLVIVAWTVALGAGALLALRVAVAAAAARHRETFRVTFPRSVEPQQLTAALRSIQGLVPRFPDRLLVTRTVVLETCADASGITHLLSVPPGVAKLVLGQFSAAVPGFRAEAVERDATARPSLARELHATGSGLLRTETTAESNAALLATMQPLGPGEAAVVQWAISPTEPIPGWLLRLRDLRGGEPSPVEDSDEPVLRAVCRIGVTGPRPDALLARVLGASHRADAAARRLARRMLPSVWVARQIARAATPILTSSLLAADELATVIGVPVSGPQLPGLGYAESRTLPPAPSVPTQGRVLGDAIATSRPVAISEAQSKTGLLITSPTGAGKSTVLEHLCAADFAAGRGVVVIESKGDLCGALADLVPAARLGDVVVFDPADERPAGFNLLAGGEATADLITDHVVGQFRALYAGYLGPRSEMLLRAALLTLSQAPGNWTICEVMPLLSDSGGLRRRLMAKVEDHQLAATWAWFESQSEAARAEMIAPLANKLAAFTLRRKLRAVVGQSRSALDFDAALREGRIVLVSLAKALCGEGAAALLGSCILAELWTAVQRRAALPASERPFVSVVLDEAQDFLRLPVALGDAVAQSRGMGVGWTASFQNLGQLSPDLRAAVLANLRSKLVFQTTADDARAFAREFAPHLQSADLQGLGPFEAYAAVSTGASVAPPASIRTRPPLAPTGHGEAVRARSRGRYGRSPADVDAEVQARLSQAAPEAPVGARRRR